MSKQQKQILILAVMGIVLVAVLFKQFASSSEPSSKPTSKPSSAVAKTDGAGKTAKASGVPKAKGEKGSSTSKKSADKPESVAADGSAIKRTDVEIDQLLASIKEVDFEYDPAEIPRDPMRPLIGTVTANAEEEAGDPVVLPATANRVREKVVSGIVWSQGAPVAIVDNEIVTPGYIYPDGTAVESIGPDRVVFKVAESLIQVQLKEP